MKPSVQKILTKLAKQQEKVELSEAQRVELASIKDLQNAVKVANQVSQQLDFELNEVKRYPSELRRLKQLLDVQFEPVVKTIDKRIQDLGSMELVISKQVKELGINESSVKEIQQAEQLREVLKKKMFQLEQGIKDIKAAAKSIV